MALYAALVALFGYALFLNRFFKWPLDTTFLFVSCSIICVLYYAGLMGGLLIPAQVLMLIGIVLFVVFMTLLFREESLGKLMKPGVLFFLLGVLVLVVVTSSNSYGYFVFWDDFSHWARVSKVICLKQAFIQMDDPVWFKDYPPGTALFHYFFCQLGGYTEHAALFAHGILLLAAFTQLLVVVKKEHWHILGVFLLFCYLVLYTFDTGLHTLGVDLVIASFFGVGIAGYWLSNRSLASIIRLVPVTIALPLIKSAGMFLSCVIILIIVTDQIWLLKHKHSRAASLLCALFLVPLLFITQISWTQHVKKMGAAETLKTDISTGKVIDSFTPGLSTERQKKTISNFIGQFTPFSIERMKPNVFFWYCLLLLAVSLFIRHWEDESIVRGSLNIHLLWLFGGLCAYLLGLLVMYMFSFGEYEGVRLASFSRYIKIYLVGFSIILFSILLKLYLLKKQGVDDMWKFLLLFSILCIVLASFSRLLGFGIALLAMLLTVYLCKKYTLDKAQKFLLIFPMVIVFFHIFYTSSTSESTESKNINRYCSLIQNNVPANKKVYFIWQQSTGLQLQMLGYGIIPRFSNQGCWSIGEPYYQGDVWTCSMDVEAFRSELHGYDYLFVAHADNRFRDQFSSLFNHDDVDEGHLFRIAKDRNTLRLTRVN